MSLIEKVKEDISDNTLIGYLTINEIEYEIRNELVNNKDKMPYWIGAQLNFLG